MNARKLKNLQKQMDQAVTYQQWSEAAQQHDEISGQKRWRRIDKTSQYDYAQIRLRLDKLRYLRARQDYQGLLFTLNEGIHGNLGGMGRHSLYSRAKFGTKTLIEQYVDEVDDSLRFLAELKCDEITTQQKLDFFYRANICFGRSALMLSGGGVLGFYHMGVVKTLLNEGLLPRVISGSSAGALVAAVIGTHTDEELEYFYDPANVVSEAEQEASAFSKMFFGANPRIDVGDLEKMVARMVPDLTFHEAYEQSGRQISISIAPAELHQQSRLLNAITSPNVYVRAAVMASCAVPGVFPPVMLMAKNQHGEAQPYLPNQKWVDGSIADDLPAKRLQRLYSANHFIVSMVNPIAIPFLNKNGERSPLGAALGTMGIGVGREILNLYRGIAQKRGDTWPRVNMFVSSMHGLIDQQYSGDINITPNFSWYNPAKLLSHLSEEDLVDLMEGGENSTFSAVEAVRVCTRISRTMEEILTRFEQGDLRPNASEYHRPRTSRRRPSPTKADRNASPKQRLQPDPVKKMVTKQKSTARKRGAPTSKLATSDKTAAQEGSRARRTA
ncbi:MAG: DUF3336 domain-containing protein [Halioglobus sp.]|nr:DUF3336 domain-containing protein [Halioglobus sp.]